MNKDASDFLETLLFTIPEDEPGELREASVSDFSPEFIAAVDSFVSGFRIYLKVNHPELEPDECQRSFGGNVYFSLSGHGCGFWDDLNGELGDGLQKALEAYSGRKYRFEELDGMLSRDADTGKVDLSFIHEVLAKYRQKCFSDGVQFVTPSEVFEASKRGGLPAVRIHLDDGRSYVTSVSKGISWLDVESYFLGREFTDENPSTGEETCWKCIKVEPLI
jgi:hypothetical protein